MRQGVQINIPAALFPHFLPYEFICIITQDKKPSL